MAEWIGEQSIWASKASYTFLRIHIYIHTKQLLTTLMLCALILCVRPTVKCRLNFWETFSWQIFYSQSFCHKSAEKESPKIYFCFHISFWCLNCETNPGFMSNKPRHYLLDHADFEEEFIVWFIFWVGGVIIVTVRSLVRFFLLEPNVANILLFNFCEQKFVQHGPITIAIDCNGLSLLFFEE